MKWFASLVVVSLAAIAIAVITLFGPNEFYTHRYRMTVEVEFNGSKRVGSSVIEVTWVKQPQSLPIGVPEFVANVRGDATVIELDDRSVLVALLGPVDPLDAPTPPELITMRSYGLSDSNTSIPLIAKQTGIRRLEGKDVPALVIFADKAKPDSARIAKPRDPDGELAPGIKFRNATIEITSDPVTNDFGEKLPWWSMSNRPATVARQAWLEGRSMGSSIEPKSLFRRG
jgi:hypothetical protein